MASIDVTSGCLRMSLQLLPVILPLISFKRRNSLTPTSNELKCVSCSILPVVNISLSIIIHLSNWMLWLYGSSLGICFDNIFICVTFSNCLLSNANFHYYRSYVDDHSFIIPPEQDSPKLLATFSAFPPCIKIYL